MLAMSIVGMLVKLVGFSEILRYVASFTNNQRHFEIGYSDAHGSRVKVYIFTAVLSAGQYDIPIQAEPPYLFLRHTGRAWSAEYFCHGAVAMEQSPNQPLRCLTVQNEDTTRLARDTFGVFLRFTSEAAFSIPPPDPRHPYPNTPTPSLVPSISNISLSHLNSAFFPSCRIGVVLAAVGMPFSRTQIPVTSPITRRVLDEDVHAIYQKRNKALGHGYQLSEARDIFDIHDNNMSDVGLVVGLKYFRAAFTLTVVADKIWRIGLAKMAQSTSYYVKNIFSSSYGSDRPSFFIWYPKGTPASEKKLLHKVCPHTADLC